MITGLPWDNPNADPLGDMLAMRSAAKEAHYKMMQAQDTALQDLRKALDDPHITITFEREKHCDE